MLYRYGCVKEYGCRTREALCLLRRVVTCRATTRKLSRHLGVTYEVLLKRLSDQFALSHYLDRGSEQALYLRHQYRVVGAAEDDRIDLLVLCQESLEMLAHEEVGSLGYRSRPSPR